MTSNNIIHLKNSLDQMFKVNFQRKPHEFILFVSDFAEEYMLENIPQSKFNEIKARNEYTKKLFNITKELYGDKFVKMGEFPSVLQSGLDAPQYVAEELKKCDIFIIPTTFSLTHTNTRMQATEAGARGATLPAFEPYMFDINGSMTADYSQITKEIIKGMEFISRKNPNKSKKVHITSKAGTNLTLKIMEGSRKLKDDNGLYTEKGSFGNLPAGEIFTAPMEGIASGTMVIENGWTVRALEGENLTFKFKDGLLVSLSGAKDSFLDLVDLNPKKKSEEDPKLIKTRRNVAELGIGMNPKATHYESVLEGEKIKGTCHIAIGTNKFFGGNILSDIHLDFIINKPTILIENEVFMENGKFAF
jgi:leucyl aminopeptidase (aminopeptidase T)